MKTTTIYLAHHSLLKRLYIVQDQKIVQVISLTESEYTDLERLQIPKYTWENLAKYN